MRDLTLTDEASSRLLLAADFLSDVESLRIATENRVRALEQGKDHEHRELPPLTGIPIHVAMSAQLDAVLAIEKQAIADLRRELRAHPLHEWVLRTVGIGEKQGARLLAAIGDPYMRPRMEFDDGTVEEARPRRGPAELWAYCGYAPGQKRKKGVKSNWNATAKMRARRCAESCIKQMHSPYREVYDRERWRWSETHPDSTDGHHHNHALRIVAKTILKDLFLEARDLATAKAPAGPKGQPRSPSRDADSVALAS